MTIKRIFTCNICDAERKETNHWFYARLMELGIQFLSWEHADPGELEEDGIAHICGQACAHKMLDVFLSNPAALVANGDDANHGAIHS